MRLSSLRGRLAAAMAVVLLLGAGGMTVLLSLHARSTEELLEDTSLLSQARETLRGVTPGAGGAPRALRPPRAWAEAYRTSGAAYFTLYDAQGRELARSANLASPLARIPLAPGAESSRLSLSGPDQALAQAVRAPGGGELVVARTNPGSRIAPASDERTGLLLLAIYAAAVAGAGLAVAATATWSLRPLRRATLQAAEIGPDRPDARLDLAGLPTEVAPLAAAANAALDRVAQAYVAERRFTADSAHALRTPLSVVDLRLQAMEAGGAGDLPAFRRDVDELSRIVAALLRLARHEHAPSLSGPVNFARVVREAAASVTPALEADRRPLTVDVPDAVPVRGDAGALRDAVIALLDNARVHGRGGVQLHLRRVGAEARLIVSDAGVGPPTGAAERIFERFHKADGASPGAGLGLAIVRRVGERHGGGAGLVTGSTFELRLAAEAQGEATAASPRAHARVGAE